MKVTHVLIFIIIFQVLMPHQNLLIAGCWKEKFAIEGKTPCCLLSARWRCLSLCTGR